MFYHPTGETVLLAAGLTLLVTVALTLFTFFAAKRGADFNFLGPFLLCALFLLMAFGIIRVCLCFSLPSSCRFPTLLLESSDICVLRLYLIGGLCFCQQIIFPMGRVGEQVIGCVGALVFSGFIIYDTDNLIKRFNYDQYIEAASCLYLDIINLFLYILALFGDD